MSTTVDSRVVEMRFDNKQFEQGVATTISTLEKFKEKLNLKGATKGLEEVDAAANRVNMANLGSAVETVGLKFNAMYTIADQALRNITNSAVNTGKRIASALTIDPIKTGLSEYETQINAVQTILANTESKGSTLQQVNAALDTLNTYADKTIYNFTEMTRNIGTFTAAGVDLNTSVNAIQGIANLAAVSGSNSQQASTAMYQLSQALSSGSLKLMDWNSVVNAGMGGQVFQDALKETAKVHGVNVDKMIKKHGSFRESLSEGWITSDILTETLSHFTMAAEEGSAAWDKYKKSLMDQGYTEEQALAILKMSNTATDAATKVKTASQLWDTLQETAQSGWTQTWEIIMGDFGEAKRLFSELYETVSPLIESMSEARNKVLEGGLSTGWKQLLAQGIPDEAGYKDAFTSIAKDHGVAIDDMIKAEKELDSSLDDSEAFQKALKKGLADGSITSDMFADSVTKLADKMRNMSDKEMEAAGYTQDHLLQIEELEQGIKDGTVSMDEFAKKIARPSGRENLIEALLNAFHALLEVFKPIKEAFREIFPAMTGEQLYEITQKVLEFSKKLAVSEDTLDKIKRTFKGLFAVLDIVKQAFGFVFKAIAPLFGKMGSLSGSILDTTASIGDWLVNLNGAIKRSGFFTLAVEKIHKAFEAVRNFLKPVIEGFKSFAEESFINFKAVASNAEERLGPLSALGQFLKAVFTGIGNIIKKVFPYVAAAASAIGKVVQELVGRISDAIQNSNYDGLFDFISSGIIATIGVFIAKFIKSGSGLLDNAGGFLESIQGILGGVGDALGAFTDSLKADTLKKIATAIGILAVSLLVLSLIPSDKLATALFSITTLFGELMGSMAIFSKITAPKGLAKTAGAMIKLAAAVFVLSLALKIMSTMSWSELAVGLTAMTVGIGELVGAVYLLSIMPEKELKSSVKAIKGLASALLVLSVALKIMSTMSWEGMGIALISMTVGLGAMVAAVNLLPKDTAKRAAGLVGLAVAMVILGAALKIMATMSWGELAVSLVALAGSLAILVGALHLMKSAIPGALAMMIVAPALVVLAGALKILSTMSWGDVARGLVALGGSMIIIAGAMYLMSGAIPGALALMVVTAALAVLTPVLMLLGSMSLAEIGKALLVLAGVFAVLGVAALLLTPVIPAILGLAAAVALLGVACVAIGAGILMIGAGLTLLAASLAASGGAITIFITSIISLIPFLIEQIGLGIIKLCEVIGGSAAAICEAITVIILAVVDALVTAVPPLVDGLMVLLVSVLDSLITYLPTIVSKLVTLLVELILLVAEHVPTLVEALFTLFIAIVDALASNISRLVQPLVNLVVSIFQGLADAIGPIINEIIVPILSAFKDIIVGISEAIGAALEGLASIFDSVFNGIATIIESVGNAIKSVLDGIAGIIDSIGNAALNAGTGFENLANGVKTITDLKLADMVASLGAVATGIGSISKHSGQIKKVGDGMKNLTNNASPAATGLEKVSKASEAMSTKLSKAETALDKFVKAVGKCVDTIKDKAGEFKTAGKDLVTGFANGITDNTYLAKARAKAMAAAAAEAARKELDEHSPSKVGYGIGDFFGVGFVNGIADNVKSAYKTSTGLAKSAREGINNAIGNITAALNSDMDSQPTIRPVLDLSGVKTGVGALSRMLDMDSSVGVRSNITAIASTMGRRSQNGGNADIISAINKLNSKMDNLGNTTYQINGITYDDGSNITTAVADLVRAARIERRV